MIILHFNKANLEKEYYPGIFFFFQSTFQECLVDARMLEHISKKEHQKYLKLVDGFHRLVLGVALLITVDYICMAQTDKLTDWLSYGWLTDWLLG